MIGPITGVQTSIFPESDKKLMAAAQQLEATFLAQMLKSAGMGATRESFGGGAGEDQFASFPVRSIEGATK